MNRSRLQTLVAFLLVAGVVLASPAVAGAWTWNLQNLDLGAGGTAKVVAKKCKGGKLGNYHVVGDVGNDQLLHHVEYDLPVTPKAKHPTNVQLSFSGPGFTNVPPQFQAELINAYTNFYATSTSKYKQKKKKAVVIFRHQGVVLFGQQLFPPGSNTVPFKPKKGC
jgi:hypothetical protein